MYMNISTLSLLTTIFLNFVLCTTLQSVFDESGPANGYDKYLVLDNNIIYTGEIGIYEGSVFIEGNGSVVDLNSGLGIWAYADENYPASLDIEYLTIINGGYNGVTYNGSSSGNIINCNFISNDYGIQIMDEANVNIKNSNFINSGQYGIAMRGTTASFQVMYSNFWDNNSGSCGYNENCWGLTWVPLELEGSGLIENNPLFSNVNEWDFSYNDDSPCIDAGDPSLLDDDGTRRDIGGYLYIQESIPGDCNDDSIQNVLDIVYLINDCILLSDSECGCGDLNEDSNINVLDVVLLVNQILEV